MRHAALLSREWVRGADSDAISHDSPFCCTFGHATTANFTLGMRPSSACRLSMVAISYAEYGLDAWHEDRSINKQKGPEDGPLGHGLPF